MSDEIRCFECDDFMKELDNFVSTERYNWKERAKDHALKYVQTDDIREKQDSYGYLMVSVSIEEIVGRLKERTKYLSGREVKGCKYKLEKMLANQKGDKYEERP